MKALRKNANKNNGDTSQRNERQAVKTHLVNEENSSQPKL